MATLTRIDSMAGLSNAVEDIVYDAYWNPARLPRVKKATIITDLDYSYLYERTNINNAGVIDNDVYDENDTKAHFRMFVPITISDVKSGLYVNANTEYYRKRETSHEINGANIGERSTFNRQESQVFDLGLGVALNDEFSVGAGFYFRPQKPYSKEHSDTIDNDYYKIEKNDVRIIG